MNAEEIQGCYCYWSNWTQVLVHVFVGHADRCTCKNQRLRRI